MDNELTFVLSTSELKDAGFEGSFNSLADELAEMDCVVTGSYDEDGSPIITVVGISPEELGDKLSEYGVEDASQFTTPVEPSEVEGVDLDTDQDGDDITSEEEDGAVPEDEEDVEIEEDTEEEDDNLEDDPEDEEDDPEDEPDDDPEDESNDDGEVEIIEDDGDLDDGADEDDHVVDESKKTEPKLKGTKNISESLMSEILESVKDEYLLKRVQMRSSMLNEMKKAQAKREQELNEEFSKPVSIYLNSWSNSKVNGIEIWKYRNVDIVDLLAESKKNYRTVYKKYKSLNESSTKKRDFVRVLKKQRKLIELLEAEYRFRNINEDNLDQGGQDLESAAAQDNSQDDTQEASLTSIVFKVKDADEFIKVLTDNGIPAEALKKGSEMQDDGSDNDQQDEQQQADQAAPAPDAMGGAAPAAPAATPAASSNPFESVTTPLTKKNKLNEDGNPFDQLAAPDAQGETNLGDPDQPGPVDGVDPLNTDESADTGEGEEVILTDTSYASKVQKILEDIYGYSKKDFEDKIGGEIVDDGGSDGTTEDEETNPFDNIDGSDEGSDDTVEEEDDDKVGQETSISPVDIFGDI